MQRRNRSRSNEQHQQGENENNTQDNTRSRSPRLCSGDCIGHPQHGIGEISSTYFDEDESDSDSMDSNELSDLEEGKTAQ